MFARLESIHENVEVFMGESDVRAPKRWDDLDTDSLELRSFEDDNLLEPLQLRLTDDVDLDFVVRSERRNAVLAPGRIPSAEPHRVRTKDVRAQFVASHNEQRRRRDGGETDPRPCFRHTSTILMGCSLCPALAPELILRATRWTRGVRDPEPISGRHRGQPGGTEATGGAAASRLRLAPVFGRRAPCATV